MDFIDFFVTLLTIVGAITSVAVGVVQVRNLLQHRMPWRVIDRAIDQLAEQMVEQSFAPDAIFAMGRGGAVMAGLLSSRLGSTQSNVPIYMIDRDIKLTPDGREARILEGIVDLVQSPKKVLLVAGVNASGGTLIAYTAWLKNSGAQEVKSCVIAESLTSRKNASFVYRKYGMDPKKLKMPWYKKGLKDWAIKHES